MDAKSSKFQWQKTSFINMGKYTVYHYSYCYRANVHSIAIVYTISELEKSFSRSQKCDKIYPTCDPLVGLRRSKGDTLTLSTSIPMLVYILAYLRTCFSFAISQQNSSVRGRSCWLSADAIWTKGNVALSY